MRAPGAHRLRYMQKSLLLCGTAIAALALTACDEEYGYYDDRPGYYADHPGYYAEASGPSVDFYYVESRPYSRSYGPLYLRDGNYYYSRGGSYVVYDRPTRVYRNTNYRVVNRDVNVRNVRYNNVRYTDERVVRDQRYRDRNVVGERYRRDYPERRVETRQQQTTRQRQATTPQTVRVRSDQRGDGRQMTVEKSNQRKVKSSQRKNQRKQSEVPI